MSSPENAPDREFFHELRAQWSERRLMPSEQAEHLAAQMHTLDELCEKLWLILRKEILPATSNQNDEELHTALVNYDVRLWELEEYIEATRSTLDDAVEHLELKLEKLESAQEKRD